MKGCKFFTSFFSWRVSDILKPIKPLNLNYSSDDFWNLLKRNCSPEELATLNRNLISCNGLKAADNRSLLLNGLVLEEHKWNDHWVVIMNIFGLAYQDSAGIIHTGKINEYISDNVDDLKGFYLFWNLFFQYPYGKKHTSYFRSELAVQPMVAVIQHLKLLFEIAVFKGKDPFENAYLSSDEFALIVTKLRSNDIFKIMETTSNIMINRKNEFNYTSQYSMGERDSMLGLLSYVGKYYNLSPLITYEPVKFKITSWRQYYQICSLLKYREKPYIMCAYNEREGLYRYFTDNIKITRTLKNDYEYLDNMEERLKGVNSKNLSIIISKNLNSRGVYFNSDFIESFLLSLKTKPFLILSGISGVGKSLLPNIIMELAENNSCKPIAVAPNWVDNTDMLGYFDLEGTFIMGEFTSLVMEAKENLSKPYFVILDEMNLAKVELYFAQVLSCIESRALDSSLDKVVYKNSLFNKSYRDRFIEKSLTLDDEAVKEKYISLANLTIPSNVYIIGTVNIDESTHPFSKKVLDRANVIEINEVNLEIGLDLVEDHFITHGLESGYSQGDDSTEGVNESSLDEELEERTEGDSQEGVQEDDVTQTEALIEEQSNIVIINAMLEGKVTNFKELTDFWSRDSELLEVLPLKETLQKWIEELSKFNSILINLKQNFGLRVRDEVCIYLFHSALINYEKIDTDANWWHKYFDQQLLQKVLTRVEGEAEEIEEVLKLLFNLCTYSDYEINQIVEEEHDFDDFKYPGAAKKIKGMLTEIILFDKPATTFWSV